VYKRSKKWAISLLYNTSIKEALSANRAYNYRAQYRVRGQNINCKIV
jgi:hypothetical protein